MAQGHGKDSDVRIADSGGTSRNLTSFTNQIDTSWDAAANESTTMGNSAVRRVRGLADNSFTLGGVFDNNGTASPDAWLKGLQEYGSAVAFVIFPNGSASGRPYDSGSALLTSYSKSMPVDNVVTWQASFACDGSVARGTV